MISAWIAYSFRTKGTVPEVALGEALAASQGLVLQPAPTGWESARLLMFYSDFIPKLVQCREEGVAVPVQIEERLLEIARRPVFLELLLVLLG